MLHAMKKSVRRRAVEDDLLQSGNKKNTSPLGELEASSLAKTSLQKDGKHDHPQKQNVWQDLDSNQDLSIECNHAVANTSLDEKITDFWRCQG